MRRSTIILLMLTVLVLALAVAGFVGWLDIARTLGQLD